jgi:uncharacterized protein YggE
MNMNRMNRRIILCAAAASAIVGALPASAQQMQPPPRILVTGEGEAALAPDMAILSLTVMREADTAAEAMREANAAMASVIAAIKEASVEPRDIQTSGLQINPQYNYPSSSSPSGEAPRVTNYQVQNTLVVRVRKLDTLGSIIDRAVELGVNQGANITLTNDDPGPAITEARKRAIADAIGRARTLAQAGGVEVGPILEISEQSQMPRPMPMEAKAFRAGPASDGVPVEFGENTYRVSVNVTFEIKG